MIEQKNAYEVAVRAAADKKGAAIEVLDMSQTSLMADQFVIVTACGLNGGAADNTLAVNFNVKLLFNCLGNLCCCDRTKELAFLANLGINNDELTIKGSFGSLCVCKSLSLTLSNVVKLLR